MKMSESFHQTNQRALASDVLDEFWRQFNQGSVPDPVLLRYLTIFTSIECYEECEIIHNELDRRGIAYEWHPVRVNQ